MIDDDSPTPDELEQLARSLAMDGSLGRADAQRVAAVLREVAARRRHPSGRALGPSRAGTSYCKIAD